MDGNPSPLAWKSIDRYLSSRIPPISRMPRWNIQGQWSHSHTTSRARRSRHPTRMRLRRSGSSGGTLSALLVIETLCGERAIG